MRFLALGYAIPVLICWSLWVDLLFNPSTSNGFLWTLVVSGGVFLVTHLLLGILDWRKNDDR